MQNKLLERFVLTGSEDKNTAHAELPDETLTIFHFVTLR